MSLKYALDKIIETDMAIRFLVRSKTVITLNDIREFKRLKSVRSGYVRTVQHAGKGRQS